LILIDAYIGALYVPFQLSTKEFFDLTQSHLKNKGILTMMVLAENPQKEKVFQYLTQTIKSIYPYTYFFPDQSRREYLVVGSKFSLGDKFLNLEERTDIEELKELSLNITQNFQEVQKTEKKYILKDNRAPIDLLAERDRIFSQIQSLFSKN